MTTAVFEVCSSECRHVEARGHLFGTDSLLLLLVSGMELNSSFLLGVLASIISASHRVESLERRETWLRMGLHQEVLWANLEDMFLINDWWGRTRPISWGHSWAFIKSQLYKTRKQGSKKHSFLPSALASAYRFQSYLRFCSAFLWWWRIM